MEENTPKIIDIKPLNKWKRILVFLGDYFISFIISFALFNVLLFPLAKIAFHTEEKYALSLNYEKQATDLLIDNGFLFKEPSKSLPSFEEDVNYSFKVFLSYYAFDNENADANNPQYGHKVENEIIYHYFKNVLDEDSYISAFTQENAEDLFFDIGPDFTSIKLKNEYKNLLANELLEVTDEDNYSSLMINFRDHLFARLFYIHVYNHITANDLVIDGVSYNNLVMQARQISKRLQWIVVITSLLSTFIGFSFSYLLYPLINKDKRTFTMSILKVDRLNFNNLSSCDNKAVLIASFYHLIFVLSFAIFQGSLYFGLAYMFNLPLLLIFGAISLLAIIISGMFILLNEYNRSGSDILSFVVLVPTSEIDNLYKEQLDERCLSSEGISQ